MEKYYAIVNVVTEVEELKKTGENIGIDFRSKNISYTFQYSRDSQSWLITGRSNDKKNTRKKLSRKKKYMSKNYQKTLKKYHKWVDRKNNKIKKYIPPHKQKKS